MNIIITIIVSLLLIGCSNEAKIEEIDVASKVVVDGWIEKNDVAYVILSKSVPINQEVNQYNAFNYVIRNAKVSISDGNTEEILSLKTTQDRIPPYIYYGKDIIGAEGKTYTLKIEYNGKVITATTSISNSVNIDKVTYQKQNSFDTKGNLHIQFTDPLHQKNYYQIATKVKDIDSLYVPSLFGNLDDSKFQTPNINWQIKKGITLFPKSIDPDFTDGKEVFVKLRTMTKASYDFWNSWQNEIVNGQNPIFPSNTSLKSNINGGIGIWAGYGTDVFYIRTQ